MPEDSGAAEPAESAEQDAGSTQGDASAVLAADYGPPIVRRPIWVVGLVLSLGLAAFIPWYGHWIRGDNAATKVSLISSGFLPVLPILLLGLIALVWNPVVRWFRASALAVLPRELLIIAAMVYCIAGIAEGGLLGPLKGSFFMDQTVATKPKLRGAKEAGPYPFSLASEYEVKETLKLNEKVLTLLQQDPPENEADWQKQLKKNHKGYGKLVLTEDRLPTNATLDSINALATGQAADRDAIRSDLQRVNRTLAADMALLNGLREGKQNISALWTPVETESGTGPSPASKMIAPLWTASLLTLAALVFIIGLGAFTAKQWTHHERLQHPLIQVPTALARRSILRDRGFVVAVGAMVVIWLYQLGSQYDWHVLPSLPLGSQPLVHMPELYKVFGFEPQSSKWVYQSQWGALKLYPYVVAIAFLLAADVGFSIWGGFFFGCLIFGYLNSWGLPVDFYKHVRKGGGSGGAMLAMALVIFWLGRVHYWRLLKAAFGVGKVDDDRAGVLGARMVLASGLAILLLVWYYGGADGSAFIAGLLTLAFVLTFVLVTARVVAEAGLACFQSASLMNEIVYGLGIPWMLPFRAVVLLNYLGATILYDTRQHLAGYTAQSQAMADQAGKSHVGLVVALLIVVVAGAAIAFGVDILATWSTHTGVGIPQAGGFGVDAMVATVDNGYKPVFLGLTEKQLSILGGFTVVFLVVGLRRIWTGCILHPLGLVVAASWPVHLVWGSLMIGWLAKVIVLRYGGPGLYGKVKPAAIGLILGDALGYGVMLGIQAVGHLTNNEFATIQAWP